MAAALVATNDPAAPGSRFPACPLHALTGLWCPLCGLTRGTHELLTGHPAQALGYNVFTPVVLLAIIVGWWFWLRAASGRPTRPLVERVPGSFMNALPVLLIGFSVLRNLPGLGVLAP